MALEEFQVGKLCQYNQSPFCSLEGGIALGCLLTARLLQTAHLLSAFGAFFHHFIEFFQLISPCFGILLIYVSAGILPITQVLIATHFHTDRRSVGQCDGSPLSPLGGNGSSGKCDDHR